MTRDYREVRERLKSHKASDDGFSMVEMLVSIMILAMIALMAFPLFARSLMLMDLSNITTAATISTQTLIEEIRKDPTCVNINSVIRGNRVFEDSRGKEYTIEIELPEACTNGELVPVTFTAIRGFDDRVLYQQSIQVLVLLPGTFLEVD